MYLGDPHNQQQQVEHFQQQFLQQMVSLLVDVT